jgi:hypothetical protein
MCLSPLLRRFGSNKISKMGDHVPRLFLSVCISLVFAVSAEAATTCTAQKAYCRSVNKAEKQGDAGQARCEEYFTSCMQTGVWTSRRRTITGLVKR